MLDVSGVTDSQFVEAICTQRSIDSAAVYLGVPAQAALVRLKKLYARLDLRSVKELIRWAVDAGQVDESQVFKRQMRKRYIEYIPSPEEIDQRAAEIRRGWTPEDRESRRVSKSEPWQLPEMRTGRDSNSVGRGAA